MKTLRRIARAVGVPALVACLVIPVLVGCLVWQLSNSIVAPNYRASAIVPVSEVTGKYASFDAATDTTDFRRYYAASDAARAAAAAAGVSEAAAATSLAANRQGDTTSADVTFDGPSSAAAEAGVRAATSTALRSLLATRRDRLQIEVQGLQQQRDTMVAKLRSADPQGNKAAEGKDIGVNSLKSALDSVANELATREADLAAADIADNRIPTIATSIATQTTQLSTVSDRLRMAASAALSALLLFSGLNYLIARTARRRRSQEFGDRQEVERVLQVNTPRAGSAVRSDR